MNVFDAVDCRFRLAKPEKKEASIGYYPILKLAPTLWKESKAFYEQQKHKPSQNKVIKESVSS
ncbi:MAG: hypothetical protein QM751_07550 [Paludibacteraceae bacterium]